jgi:hypothetical protein
MSRRNTFSIGLALAIGVLASTAYVACSGPPVGGPAAGASDGGDGGDAAVRYYYFLNPCPPLLNCEPLKPVPIDSGEPTCSDLGIVHGSTPCVHPLISEPCALGPILRDDTPGREDCRKRPQLMLCAEKAPTDAGCGVSTAAAKRQIQYLTTADRSQVAAEVRSLPLVRYRYKTDPDDATPTVGIVIEDVPLASFVEKDGKHVNLYSFISATAAAYQAQADELDAVRVQLKEFEQLKARLAAVEAACGANSPTTPPTLAPTSSPARPPTRSPRTSAPR